MDEIGSSITLHQLRCAVAVADLGTVTMAANVLGLAQPSVSQQLGRLESELGFPLFRRRSRRMVTTPAGAVALSMAREVLERLSEGVAETRRVAGGAPSTLTVGILSSLATSVFPETVVRWQEWHPEQPLRLREELRRMDLESAIRRADVDLAVGAPPEEWSGTVVFVGDEELALVIPPRRRTSLGRSARLAGFADDPWVVYDPDHGLHTPVVRACAAAGFQPREVLRTRQVDTAVRMAAAGVGVAVAPVGSVPSELSHLMVICRPILRSPVAVWGLEGTDVVAERLAVALRPSFRRR